MQLKDNKMVKRAVVLIAVVALTGAIGAGLSAQMGPRRGMDGAPGMMGFGPGGPGGPFGPGGPGGPRGGRFGGPMGLRGLDLTDAQREQVQTIMSGHREALQASGRKVMDARQALHEAVTAENSDEAVIRQKAAAVGAAEGDAAVLHATIQKEVAAVLTPEQLQQLKTRRDEMQQRMKDGRERMQQRQMGAPGKKRGGPQAV